MSTSKRISTELLKRLGVEKTTKISQNRYVDSFRYGDGTQQSRESANISLGNQNLLPSSISVNDYFTARDYFVGQGMSELNANIMSRLVSDMAEALDVSVASFLYTNSQNGVLLELQDYALMGMFRPTSNRVSALTLNDNSKCLRRKDILP